MSIERILLKGGCVLTLDVDTARVRRLTYESRDYVVSKAGFTMPAI
jgi:hypothetical protein